MSTGTFEHLTALPNLLIALAMSLVSAFAVFRVMKFMFDGELDAGPGIAAIVTIVCVMAATIMSKSTVVAGAVMVSMISLLVFFPYALDQLAGAEARGADIDRLDKAHKEIIARPENVASYFALAQLVHDLGLEGHAVVIAEQTLARLPMEIDPLTNQSIRDVFKAEESRAKHWRRSIVDTAEFRAVACPRCGFRNEPGTIACGRCQGPFLLDLARKIDPRHRLRSRLVLGWAMVAGFLTLTVWSWSVLEGDLRWVTFGGGLAAVAGVLTWLFHPRRLGRR
jgi:hypothetical protein